MLTKGDDFPLHQSAEPIAFAGTDRNFYDRYFFNGYSKAGDLFFAAALGVYPNRRVMDAAFSVVRGGRILLRQARVAQDRAEPVAQLVRHSGRQLSGARHDLAVGHGLAQALELAVALLSLPAQAGHGLLVGVAAALRGGVGAARRSPQRLPPPERRRRPRPPQPAPQCWTQPAPQCWTQPAQRCR